MSKLQSIQNKLHNYISSLCSSADIYVFNAIPYQCSFGNILYGKGNYNKEKNQVFSLTWNTEPAFDDLIDELKSLVMRGERLIIINSCTNTLKACCDSNSIKIKMNYCNLDVVDAPHVSHW